MFFFIILLKFLISSFNMINMKLANYIRKCLIERGNMQMKELAERTNQTQQNLANKMRTDDFKMSELEKIAAALDADLRVQFIDRKSGEPII